MIDDDDRIRQKANELWLAEGKPKGREEAHWAEAKEIVALKDSFATTLTPVEDTLEEPVEPSIAFENQADVPGLTDQGDGEPGPSWRAAEETANELPLSVDPDVKPH